MQLADHPGDILRKARQSVGLSMEEAAGQAGWSTEALTDLESTGVPSTSADLERLALIVRLDFDRLAAIIAGWHPKLPDQGQWREFRQITTTQEDNVVHCYLVWDEVTREAALFDTGWDPSPVLELIQQNELSLRHLFLTHLHDDHMAGMPSLRSRFPQLRLHTSSRMVPPQHRNRPNDFISLGSLRIMNRETPGHAEEGVTYVIGNWPEDAPHVAIVGDTLFAGSVATGFQSAGMLQTKIREQILTLPAGTLICPGHGPLTTVAEELTHNPFFA